MYSGSVIVDSNPDWKALPAHLANQLRGVRASSVEVSGDVVRFTSGLFRFVSNLNVLVPFGYGEVTVHERSQQVLYRVSLAQLMVAATIGVAIIAIFILVASRSLEPLIFVPIGWLWLVGGNVLIGIPRFHHFLKKAVAAAPGHER